MLSGFGTLTSRDLNLDLGTWDSFYRFGGSNHITLSEASIGDMLYTVGTSDVITGEGCTQVQFFNYRNKDDASWTDGQFSPCTIGGYDINKRNMLISSKGLLHLVNYEPGEGVYAQTYDPALGYWSYPPEEIEGYTNDQVPESPMLAGGQYGIYYFFDGTISSFHQHMRHKALVPTININAPVASSWNMTGIPTAAYRLFKSQVYPTTTVYKYDGGYFAADPLSNNRGWWASFPSAQTISYTGARIDSMRMVVKTGWNIIGSISSTISTSAVTSDPNGIITSQFYKYQNGYVPTTTIDPGGGYWVSVNQNGRIILKTGGLNKFGGEDFASYDKFIITDNSGNQQNLYVRNSVLAGTTESLEMPPAPPDGEFDARFSTNDIVRTVNPASGIVDLSIDINSAVYPVTLTWEINPENGLSYSFGGGSLGKISNSGNFVLMNQTESTIKLFGKSNESGSDSDMPNSFKLHQNYPNPFNPETIIQYDISDNVFVTLEVFDMIGEKVAELVNELKEPGQYHVTFNGSGLVSGVYLYRFQASSTTGNYSFNDVKKFVVMK